MSVEKSVSVKRNYIYNLIYQMLLIVIPLVVTPYIARVIGNESSGSFSFAYSITGYFVLLANLGFNTYAQREIAVCRDDKHLRTNKFWEIIIVRMLSVAVALCIYYVTIFANIYHENHVLLLKIFSIEIFVVFFDITFFFQGLERFEKIVFRNVLVKAVSIVCIFVFVKSESDLWKYALIQSVGLALGQISIWLYLPKFLEKTSFKELKIWRHLKPSLLLFLPSIAASVYTVLDKTLIGVITQSDYENGQYEYAEKLVKTVLTVITSLGAVMTPHNAKLFAEGKIEEFNKSIYKVVKFVFFIGAPICFGIIAVSSVFMPVYLGEGYEKSVAIFAILAPIVLIIGLSNVFGFQLMIPVGEDKKFTASITIGAITNLIFNLIFISFLQSIGAAIATVLAELSVTGTMFFFIRRRINLKECFSGIWKYLLAGIIMCAVCLITKIWFNKGIVSIIILVAEGIITYFALLLLLREQFVISFLKKVFKSKNG